jgi:hypothetical protein
VRDVALGAPMRQALRHAAAFDGVLSAHDLRIDHPEAVHATERLRGAGGDVIGLRHAHQWESIIYAAQFRRLPFISGRGIIAQ